jgi:hypothetical protein
MATALLRLVPQGDQRTTALLAPEQWPAYQA